MSMVIGDGEVCQKSGAPGDHDKNQFLPEQRS